MFPMQYIIRTFIQILTGFYLEPFHIHPFFTDLCGFVRKWPESPGRFAFLSFKYQKSVRNSGLLLGDEIIDTMLFTSKQTFEKCQFILLEFSLVSTWWDTRKTYPEIPESPRWNQQVCRKKSPVFPASVPLIEAPPNSPDWKCKQQVCVCWKFLPSNCLKLNVRCVNAI